MFAKKSAAVSPQRDPKRAALATAIAERDGIDARLEAARAAAERLGLAVSDAAARIAAAKAAMDATCEGHLERFIAGETEVLERPVRTTLRDAEDDLAVAKEALHKVAALTAQHEDARAYLERRIKSAIGEITSLSIGGVIDEAEKLRRELDGRYALVRYLAHLAPGGSEEGRRANMMLSSPQPGERWAGAANHPELEAWRAAVEALAHDADAPLPLPRED